MIQMFTRYGEAVEIAEGQKAFTRARKCGRCGGAGKSDRWAYTGYTCYDCGGEGTRGTELVKVYTAEKLAKLNAAKEKADAKRAAIAQAKAAKWAAEAQANRAAFLEANAELIEAAKPFMVTAEGQEPGFIARVMTKAIETSFITENQIAAIKNAIAKIQETARVKAASEFVGKIGERLELAVTVERVAEFPRAKFGAPWIEEMFAIVTMRDAAGNAIVVKSASFWSEKGRQLTIRGTVKEQTEFNGERQTVLARVQVKAEKESTI